uniref:Uncharacterized protein n=1 Tax=Arundo donax TaxID=35708 RepID=A0A0A8YHG1_ARUDO
MNRSFCKMLRRWEQAVTGSTHGLGSHVYHD